MYLSQAYPALAPYMKGIHLILESWRGVRDTEGWKLGRGDPSPIPGPEEGSHSTISKDTSSEGLDDLLEDLRESKLRLIDDVSDDATVMTEIKARLPPKHKPDSGRTLIVPRLKGDLQAMKFLTTSETPTMRVVRGRNTVTGALYGFGNASFGGFGSSIEHREGISTRFGLWGRDSEDASSNYRELRNLMEAVEEEASEGRLANAELWLFTDNSAHC